MIENDPLFLNPRLTELYDSIASWENEILMENIVLLRTATSNSFRSMSTIWYCLPSRMITCPLWIRR